MAAGAITPLSPVNRRILVALSHVIVHLQADVETILERLAASRTDDRTHAAHPLLSIDGDQEQIRLLHALRQPYYDIADVTIHTDGKTIPTVLDETARAVEDQLRCTSPNEIGWRQTQDAFTAASHPQQ
jgi:shikimate kinase